LNISWLTADKDNFPGVDNALEEPNGLLAAGGDLSPERLINAYSKGIFPWFDDDQPILWWSPNPRAIIIPNQLHCSRSMKKTIRKSTLHYTFDQAFNDVIQLCGSVREHNQGTWITAEMRAAYQQLHHHGYAHSIEIWNKQELVGGLYGVAIGKVFFGESMFSLLADTSKMAMLAIAIHLDKCGYKLIDCQVENDHLFTMGAVLMTRDDFIKSLINLVHIVPDKHPWDTSSKMLVRDILV
jgi:leucyl/phenylalanyl-tRNA--protein transferase